jgi:hypothetical protein
MNTQKPKQESNKQLTGSREHADEALLDLVSVDRIVHIVSIGLREVMRIYQRLHGHSQQEEMAQ